MAYDQHKQQQFEHTGNNGYNTRTSNINNDHSAHAGDKQSLRDV